MIVVRISLLLVVVASLGLTSCQTRQAGGSGERTGLFGGRKAQKEMADAESSQEEQSTAHPDHERAAGPLGRRDSYSSVRTHLPLIALTFDDGPHETNTPRLLDILKARNVKATFYVVATNARRHPEIMRRIIVEGHEVGNHTVSHGNLTKMTPDQVRKELRVAHESIVDTTGIPPRSMRPPYGAITQEQKSWIKSEFGYPSVLWSVDPEDWKRPGSSVVASRLVSGARPGGILLAHDIHKPTIDAMPSAIDQLVAKGFQFVTVTQLIALEPRE